MRPRMTIGILSALVLAMMATGLVAAEPRQQEKLFEGEITVKTRLRYLLFLEQC